MAPSQILVGFGTGQPGRTRPTPDADQHPQHPWRSKKGKGAAVRAGNPVATIRLQGSAAAVQASGWTSDPTAGRCHPTTRGTCIGWATTQPRTRLRAGGTGAPAPRLRPQPYPNLARFPTQHSANSPARAATSSAVASRPATSCMLLQHAPPGAVFWRVLGHGQRSPTDWIVVRRRRCSGQGAGSDERLQVGDACTAGLDTRVEGASALVVP